VYKTQPLVVPRYSNKQFILVGQLLPVFMMSLMLTSWRRTVWSDECLPASLKNALHLFTIQDIYALNWQNGVHLELWFISTWYRTKIWPLKFCFFIVQQPPFDQDLFIIEASRSHSDTPHSVGLPWTSDQPDVETSKWKHTALTRKRQPCPRQYHNPQSQKASDTRPTPLKSQPMKSSKFCLFFFNL